LNWRASTSEFRPNRTFDAQTDEVSIWAGYFAQPFWRFHRCAGLGASSEVIFLDFILDVVGYTTARLLLPTLTFQKVKVDVLSSKEVGFNWLGFKRLPNGELLCDADSAG
jgi:hypothetical protein